jgi:hypothetical protein
MRNALVSVTVVGLLVAALSANELACSSSTAAAKVCSQSEESACTTAYTDCSTKASVAADKVACQKCVDTYCSCYSSCGNTCDKSQLSASCQ